MRQAFFAIGLLLSCSNLHAQPAPVPAAIAALKSALKAPVTWDASRAQNADVTCDGKSDVLLLGAGQKTAGNETVWVGVVPAGGKPLAMQFPISKSLQNGFCRSPIKITTKPIACETKELGHLEGCEPVKACKDFAVEDGQCNPFHFYWDTRLKGIRSWRK